MRHALLIISLTITAAAAVPGRAAPAAADPVEKVLAGDSRLQRKVSLGERDHGMTDVLATLGKELGVPLTASRETADDKVTAFVKERTAAETLTLLSRHFDFQWVRDRKGYQLTQDLQTRRREANLRIARRQERVAKVRQRMEAVASLANTPADKLAARQAEVAGRLQDPNLTEAQRATLREEADVLRAAARPGATVAVALYRQLNPAQLQQLWSGGGLSLSTQDGMLPTSVISQIQEAGRDTRNTIRSVGVTISGAQAAPGPPPGADQPPTGATVNIRLTESARFPTGAGNRPTDLRLDFIMLLTSGDGAARRVMSPVAWSTTSTIARPAAPPPATQSDDPDLQQQVTLAFEERRAPEGPAVLGAPTKAVTLGEVLSKLGEASGLEFLSDCYVRGRIESNRITGRKSVGEILDTISRELDYRWEKRGKLVRLRSGSYPDDRASEVPNRLLRPWEQRVSERGTPSLDELAELASILNDDQLRGMQDYWTWYLEASRIPPMSGRQDGIYGARHHLRFWAGLTLAQRKTAFAGDVVPVARMSRVQAQAFTVALTADETGPMGMPVAVTQPMPTTTLVTPSTVAAGGFTLRKSLLQQRMLSGQTEDGQQVRLQTISPPMAAGGPAPTIQLPSLPGLTIQGSETTGLGSYTFNYHLAGSETPARSSNLAIPEGRPRREP